MSRDTQGWLMPTSSPITSCVMLFFKYMTVTSTANAKRNAPPASDRPLPHTG